MLDLDKIPFEHTFHIGTSLVLWSEAVSDRGGASRQHMCERVVVLEPPVLVSLDTIEMRLRRRGFPHHVIEGVAAAMFQVIFVTLPQGKLVPDPIHVGPDPKRIGFTRYSFCENNIYGLYSANPNLVYLQKLGFSLLEALENGSLDEELARPA